MIWDSLLERLQNKPKQQELPELDEKFALGALMVRVAKSDNNYHAMEIGEIDRILGATYGLNAVESAKMRATCEKLEAAAPGTPDFALMIREHIDYAHRLEVAQQLWQVIIADGARVTAELTSLHEIEAMLGINPEDSPADD
jgi:uncharacterized tellurite resistance protein B-like protein